jgi:hypothetical protein
MALGETIGARKATAAIDNSNLSIDMTGLCGLVHDAAQNRVEVILIDPTRSGSPIPKHTPVLIANLRDVMNPPSDSKPTTVVAVPASSSGGVEQFGLWDLTDCQVSISRPGGAEAAGGLRAYRSDDATSGSAKVPQDVNDPEQWRDLRYVLQMDQVCGQSRVQPALLSNGEARIAPGNVPLIVAARVRLAEGILESAIPSLEDYRSVMFKFAATQRRPAFSQPVTDTVCWTLPTVSAQGNYVAIDVVPLREGRAREGRTLLVSQRGRPCRLSISNLPAENLAGTGAHHGLSDDEVGALHFGVYYTLLRNNPAVKPLPEVWRPKSDAKGAGMIRSQFCPPAWFTLQ